MPSSKKKTMHQICLVQTLKYRGGQVGVTKTERACVILRAPKRDYWRKEVSTWRSLFVFPMMKEGNITNQQKSNLSYLELKDLNHFDN